MMKRFLFVLSLLIWVAVSANAQRVMVKGKVTDNSGQPIIGAAVLEKGTTNGAITDIDGRYSLEVSSSKVILIASSLGYDQMEVNVSSASHIILKEARETLDGVVVIGYGTVAKKDLTGSVSSVAMGDIEDVPVASFTDALGGRIAGVQISASDGQPGAEQ